MRDRRWRNGLRAAPVGLLVSLLFALDAAAVPTVYSDGVTINEPGVYEGYLIVPVGPVVHMIDIDGNTIHTWHPPCGTTFVTRPIGDGHILTKSCGDVMELDWDSNVVWQHAPEPGVEFHHDWERLDNGNTLILARQNATFPDVSPNPILDDYIIEVTPAGSVVWEWHVSDHIDELGFSQERRDFIAQIGGDWAHTNSISPIPQNTSHSDPRFSPGNIVLSFRHQGVAILDRTTDQIVWTHTQRINGQHNAYMIPDDRPGGGNILLFDNGWSGQWALTYNRVYSEVLEIDPVDHTLPYIYNARDSELPNWSLFSWFIAGAERMPNGNTLIADGSAGRVFEVTPAGELIWEYVNPFRNPADFNSNVLYRAYKQPLDWASSRFAPDLTLTGDGDPGPIEGGGALRYTFQVGNNGSDPAVGAELTSATPPGTTFQAISATAGWSCSTPPVGGAGSVRCTKPSLGAGQAGFFIVDVAVDQCAEEGGMLSRSAAVSSAGTDADSGDNSIMIETATSAADCSDADLCTLDSCDGGTQQCIHDPGFCPPLDACHLSGACEPATGLCSNPPDPAADGLSCDDLDLTTCDDVCGGGACAGELVAEPGPVGETVILSRDSATTTIDWTDPPGEFNVYRGTRLAGAPFTYNHACLNPGGPTGATSVADPTVPAPGATLFYAVTRLDRCRESVSGHASGGTPRADAYACPDTGPDGDGDGVADTVDNCPFDPDATQADIDADGRGDVCDACDDDPLDDADGDGLCNGALFDPPQSGAGDPCPDDPANDSDFDGFCDGSGFNPPKLGDMDPCPSEAPDDVDGDGVCAGAGFNPPQVGDGDNCPLDANADQSDADGDGIGDVCDPAR